MKTKNVKKWDTFYHPFEKTGHLYCTTLLNLGFDVKFKLIVKVYYSLSFKSPARITCFFYKNPT